MNARVTLRLVLAAAALVSVVLLGIDSRQAGDPAAAGHIWATNEQTTHHEDAGFGGDTCCVVCVCAYATRQDAVAPDWIVRRAAPDEAKDADGILSPPLERRPRSIA